MKRILDMSQSKSRQHYLTQLVTCPVEAVLLRLCHKPTRQTDISTCSRATRSVIHGLLQLSQPVDFEISRHLALPQHASRVQYLMQQASVSSISIIPSPVAKGP